MTTYSTIKTVMQTIYGNYIKSGGFVESDSGSPTELAIAINLVHNRIASYPRNWEFSREVVTVTATGASTYDLNTLYPDLLEVTQIYDINSNTNESHTYFGNSDANITPIDGWTVRNGTLIFTGTIPPSGSTFAMQYRSQYMVRNSAGVRKQYFTAEDDTTVLSPADENLLYMGVAEYVSWKVDEESQNKRTQTKSWFDDAWASRLLRGDVTRPVDSLL